MSCKKFSSMRHYIDAHFDGRIEPEDELKLREHLLYCKDCRFYYKVKILLEKLNPKAIGSFRRLGIGLGIIQRIRNNRTSVDQVETRSEEGESPY